MSHAPKLVAVEAGDRENFMVVAEKHFRELNPLFQPDRDWRDSYFEKIRSNQSCSLCWIVAGGERAGFVLYGIEDHRFLPRKTGSIYELYVVPQWRRKGMARACAELVISELWKSSPSKIQLEVAEGNSAAAGLWRSLGFRKASERLVLARNSQAVL